MKAWALKSPYDGHLIEVHGDEGRAMRSAVMHKIYNGWDVKVVEVECDEMKNNERIVKLKEILEELSDERINHFDRMNTAKNDIEREYSRGCYETMTSVLKRIYNNLKLAEVW